MTMPMTPQVNPQVPPQAPMQKGPTPGKAPKGYSAYSTLNPEQGQAFQQLIMQLMGPAAGGANFLQQLLQGGPEAFKSFEAPYQRQFQEETIPGLAERFAGLGAQSSSAFNQSLGQAGAGLSEQLAQLRSGLQLQAGPQAINSLQNLLGMSTMGFAQKAQPFWQQALLSGIEGISGVAASAATGGISNIFSGAGKAVAGAAGKKP